jgi:uncharacterized protein YndB with AHSA1/START domain
MNLSLDFDLPHPPEKVWRALTDPALLAEWLLPVAGFGLEPGAAFKFQTQAQPGWDGIVNCRMLEIGWNLMTGRLVALLARIA